MSFHVNADLWYTRNMLWVFLSVQIYHTQDTCKVFPFQCNFMIHKIHVLSFPCQYRFIIHKVHVVSFRVNTDLSYTRYMLWVFMSVQIYHTQDTCSEFPCQCRFMINKLHVVSFHVSTDLSYTTCSEFACQDWFMIHIICVWFSMSV